MLSVAATRGVLQKRCSQSSDMQLYQKGILAHAFSCKFCKIFKNTFLTEHLCTATSVPCHSSNER